ncbi:MAG: VapC toxin family PIN domain ribonuclease [Thermoflexia bacterium]|nr:MAG: VapC toxin family PIN domain ribonuclease [Thermoflexia bacterium]
MNGLFADTSGWGNPVDASQPYHSLATAIYRAARQEGRKVITTNYVVAEPVALMISPLRIPRPTVIAFVESLRASPYVEVVHADRLTDEQVWELFKSRPDKEWSWVDCASFVVMRQRGILEALTTDRHFEQAGFVRLLK